MKTNFVFVNFGPKSWVFGAEIASGLTKLEKKGCVEIVFLGRAPSSRFRIPSLRRIWFQYSFMKKHGLKARQLRWRLSILEVESFAHAYKLMKRMLATNEWMDDLRTVRAQCAAIYGTNEIRPQDIPKRKLFYFLLIRNLVHKMMSKNFPLETRESCCIWVFNGREILESSVLEWAISRRIQTKIFERGSTSNKYEIYESSPHCNNEWWNKIENFHRGLSDNSCISESSEIQKFIERKSHGIDPFMSRKWQRYVEKEKSQSPISTMNYVCYFSVSTGEFSPFKQFDSVGGYENQFLALSELLEACKELRVKLAVRRHPNSLGIDQVDREISLWATFIEDPSVIYFGPTAKVNSYSLAKDAICSFTWRSTIGFDLIVRDLPAFAMGPAKWALCEDVRAFELDSIRDRIKNPRISLDTQLAIHKYAHYFSTFGILMKNFRLVERWGFETTQGKRYRYFIL